MIFASVLGAVTQASGVVGIFRSYESAAHAVLLGIFEMTCGVRAFASLTWPLSVRLALCAACVQFGGCSVLLQTAAQADISMPRYAMLKVLFAVLTAAITGILTRFLCPDTALPTMATRTEMLQNGGTLLSVTFSACIGLLAVFVLTYGFRHTKKTR